MKYKKIMILAIFLVSLLAISSISAADNATSDVVSVEETDSISVDEADEVVSAEDNQVIIGNASDVGTFDELSSLIENTSEGATLELDKDFKFNSSTDGNVFLNHAMTVDGKNHILDGNKNSRIFEIWSSNAITLKNIKFVNGLSGYGGAIYSIGNNLNIINCTFENDIAKDSTSGYGGAIYSTGNNLNIINCTFENNLAKGSESGYGGAIYIGGKNSNVINCTFINCSAHEGGAVEWWADDGKLVNCTFTDCFSFTILKNSEKWGSALYWQGKCGEIINCEFINSFNTGSSGCYGGAIHLSESDNTNVINCSFINNTAICGAAIYIIYSDYVVIDNCSFLHNSASTSPAIDCSFCNYGSIINCTFIENFYYGEGIISAVGGSYWNNGLVSNCSFINNLGEIPLWFSGSSIKIDNNFFNPDYNKQLVIDEDTIIIRRISNIDCSNITFSYKNSTNFLIFLKTNDNISLTNKTVKFNLINDNYYEIIRNTNDNGIAIVDNLDYLNIGIWNVTVIFEGSYNYAPCTATATITVLPANSSLTIGDVNATVGQEVSLIANVNSTLTVNEGIVTFFDDETYIGEANVINGSASLKFIPTTGDEHIITAIFNSTNYLISNNTAMLSIDPIHVEIQSNMAAVGYETTLIAKVNSTFNITEGIVSFFDGENNIGEVNVVDGVATLSYTPTTAGEHPITAFYIVYDYQSANATANLSVAKARVDLDIDYIGSVYFTTPSNFAVNVNSNNVPVNEGKIKFYVNDVLVGDSIIKNGFASFDYISNTTGTFTLLVAYEETDNYLALNTTGYFKVNQMPTTLTGESVIFDEEAYKTFTTELKDDNNNGVNGKPVKIEVIKYSGESATFNGISDANGITIYDVGKLAGGMWYVTGIYAGDQNYIKSSFADKFIVVRMNTTTDIEEIDNPQVNHNYKLKANIHDENGKLVKEGIVQFYLDGVDIGFIDLSNNQGHQSALGEGVLGATNPMFEYALGADNDLYINYVPTKAGKHTLSAVYEGTTIYKSSNSTTSFVVSNSNKKGVTITAPTVNTVYNGGKYLVVTLNDAVTGKAISGVNVKVVLNGKTSTPTTNKNGQIKVSTNGLAPKNYTAKITFVGNTKYDKLSDSAKVVVTKATPKITAKAKTFKKSVKTKKYTVTLKNNKKLIKGVTVKITVNKKTYSAKTSSKGVATFKLTKLIKKGKFTATVKSVGNKYYNAKTLKNIKITVK